MRQECGVYRTHSPTRRCNVLSDPVDSFMRLIGGQAAGLKGGRYIRYAKGTPLTNLYVSMLEFMGVEVEKIGDSTGKVDRLTNV